VTPTPYQPNQHYAHVGFHATRNSLTNVTYHVSLMENHMKISLAYDDNDVTNYIKLIKWVGISLVVFHPLYIYCLILLVLTYDNIIPAPATLQIR
jgi:hypothetical protein